MSYYDDWIADNCAEAEEFKQIEKDAMTGIWTTRDGEKIPVERMTTSHIKNTISLLERDDSTDIMMPWIVRFTEELERRRE